MGCCGKKNYENGDGVGKGKNRNREGLADGEGRVVLPGGH